MKSNTPIRIGTAIQRQRTLLNFSQDDLAAKLHVTRQTISKWELDKSYPDLNMLVTLSTTLNCDVHDLLGLKSTQKPHKHWFDLFRWNKAEKEIPWFAGGAERGEIAVVLLADLLTKIPETQTELRRIIADHYEQLMAKTTTVTYILESLQLQMSGCLRRTHFLLTPEMQAICTRLLYLSHIRGNIVYLGNW